jgi:EAL and modified HD-GYP domain-containing signal transduction protein
MTHIELVVHRQPIFDAELAVVGYELEPGSTAPAEGTRRSTKALLYDAVAIGLDRLVGEHLVFFDLDEETMVEGLPVALSPEHAVLEVSASHGLEEAERAGLAELVAAGFRVAIDHLSTPVLDPVLAEWCSIVKIEHGALDRAAIAELLAGFGEAPPAVVILGVESPQALNAAKAVGATYFQGDLLSRALPVAGRTIDLAGRARLDQVLRLVAAEKSAAEIEAAIRLEPGLVYQLLQMAAVGSYHGMRRELHSVRDAIVLLGLERIKGFLSFLMLAGRGQGSEEQLVETLVRARTCELVAMEVAPACADRAFMAGMLSGIGTLLGVPIDEALSSLALDEELREGVRGGESLIGAIVADVSSGGAGGELRTGISVMALRSAAIQALSWALDAARAAEGT